MGDHLVLHTDRLMTRKTRHGRVRRLLLAPAHGCQPTFPTTSAVSSADEKAGEEDKEVGEEEPLIQMVECQIWQGDDHVKTKIPLSLAVAA